LNFIDFNWLPVIIPFITGIFYYKYFDVKLRLAFYFVCYGFANEIIVFLLRHLIDIKNTMPSSNLYLLSTFFILCLFYMHVLEGLISKKIIVTVILLFEAISSVYIVKYQGILSYPVFPRAIGTIFILLFSILFFYKVMVEAKIKNLWKEPLIWINLAFLIYYSGSLFYSVLFNLILEYSREFSKLTVIYFSVLILLLYSFSTIGFMYSRSGIQNS